MIHVMHRFRLRREDAEDEVQDFIEAKGFLLDLLRRADRKRGKFRTFLMQSLDNHVRDAFRRSNRQKRKGEMVPLEEALAQEETQPTAEAVDPADVIWAQTDLAEAAKRMKEECDRKGRADIWGVFERRRWKPALEGCAPASYTELVRDFGLQSPIKAANVLVTGERMFRRQLRAVVGEYCDTSEEIEEELKELRAILSMCLSREHSEDSTPEDTEDTE